MTHQTQFLTILGVAAIGLLCLVSETARKALLGLLKSIVPPLFAAGKSLAHVLIQAHGNVIKNFAPRTRLLMELNKKRTSYSNEP
jgi:hypothetical protein